MADKLRVKYKLYEKTIVDFAANQDGCFFAVSHDQNFLSMLRNTLNKELIIGTDRIRTLAEESKLLAELKSPVYKNKKQLLLIERVLNNRSTLGFIKNLKAVYEDLHIIVLTTEVERQVLILLHEIGVGNFITKPVSMDTLIEKLAFTIKPQGKIGQYIDRAKTYIAKRKYQEAIDMAEKVLVLKPGSAAALMIRGDAFKGMGEIEKAEAAFVEAHEGAALYLEPLKKLADLYSAEGNLGKQLEFLEKLDRLSPLNVERKISMGEIHLEFGDAEKAEKYFDEAVVNAQKEAQVMIEDVKRSIAEKCLDGQPGMAEKFFRSILDAKGGDLRKSDIETFNRLGIALRRQGRWQDAVSEYEQALTISPNDENLLFNTAVAYSEGRRHGEAATTLEKALKINPEFGKESPLLSFHMGMVYANARHPDRARRYLDRTLELDPQHESARAMINSL